MDTSQFYLGRRLISCGTIMVVSGLLLVGFQNWLSANDARDHRSIASSMLRETGINRVTLSEWEAPSFAMSWIALMGGFVVIAIGIRIGSKPSGWIKSPRVDSFD